MITLPKSKIDNMNAVATPQGVIAAAAMDQRGSLKKSIAKEKGVDAAQVTDAMMKEFKTAVSKVLSPYASAMLLDPVWGLEASRARAKGAGLLLAYEESGYDNTQPGRMPYLLKDWSVATLQAAGANCIKILLYYSPFEGAATNEKKHAWVQRIGEECAAADIPYFLEFVGYDAAGGDEKGLAFAKQKPEIVLKSMQEFNQPKYCVDVMKVEIPVNLQFTAGTRAFTNQGTAYTKAEAVEWYHRCAAATNKPFIYLSAGVSDDQFRESLELANAAGIAYHGVLCGRATWKEGIPVYAKRGVAALEDWLADRGVKNIQALNAVLQQGAKPWWDAFGGKAQIKAA